MVLQNPFILQIDAAILSGRLRHIWRDFLCVCLVGSEGELVGQKVRGSLVRSERAGQTRRIKPGLCFVSLYMSPLFQPPLLSSFHTPFLTASC
ncbi:hypothetical protein CHARACLAT_031703 [Characodon lateralis]|uniref:Uncharacterized protein n=1 Tax=Characodon lateralis TaxID=208331 RepID=A0ABU7EP89_9TELE|nr:hypothetical protein [Characodon lateralis]